MKKVLMLTFFWPPEKTPGALRSFRFAKYLPQNGWIPEIITTSTNNVRHGWRKAFKNEAFEKIKIYRVSTVPEKKFIYGLTWFSRPVLGLIGKDRDWFTKGLLRRSRKYLQFPDEGQGAFNRCILSFVALTNRLIKDGTYRLIYVTTPPKSMAIAAGFIANLTKLPIVLDFRDPWVQNFYFTYSGMKKRFVTALEAWCIRVVQKVIVATPIQLSNLRKLHPAYSKKMEYITNGFDAADIPVVSSRQERSSSFILTHMGLTYEDPWPLLCAIKKNIERCSSFAKKFKFRWIGHNQIRGMAEQLGIEQNVEYCGYLPHREALIKAAESQALWLEVSLKAGSEYNYPLKTFEYIALGKPILGTAPASADINVLVSSACTCRFISSRHVDDIARLLMTALHDWDRGELMANTKFEYVSQFRSDHLAKRLAAVFDEIINE